MPLCDFLAFALSALGARLTAAKKALPRQKGQKRNFKGVYPT